MSKVTFCGCGYGVATHPFEDMEGLRVHELGEGTCCRMITTGSLIPTDFRMQVYNDRIEEVCTVNGQTITTWTLRNQRLYTKHDNGVWSLPKNKESTNSLPDEW
jgi:hypothetical protein